MLLKKGTRVAFTQRRQVRYGVVTDEFNGRVTVMPDDEDKEVKGPAGAFRISEKPIPPRPERKPPPVTFNNNDTSPEVGMLSKGTRVEWSSKGVMQYGIVEKGGRKTVHVIHDGGKLVTKGDARCFRPSAHPLPNADEPNSMSDYGLKSVKVAEHLSQETLAYTAIITYKGKPIARVENAGHGGPDNVHPYKFDAPNAREAVDKFLADATKWVEENRPAICTGRVYEPEASWISWERDQRQYGQTAKESLSWMEESAARIAKLNENATV